LVEIEGAMPKIFESEQLRMNILSSLAGSAFRGEAFLAR
jgi:hypothetical protein